MTQIDDFLKPESMLTPGMAGATAMMITNTLRFQFGLEPKVTCLVLSFALGTLVFIAEGTSLPKKAVYYVLNSLLIFSLATGVNTVGTQFTDEKKPQELPPLESMGGVMAPEPLSMISPSLDSGMGEIVLGEQIVVGETEASPTAAPEKMTLTDAQRELLKEKLRAMREETENRGRVPMESEKRGFFGTW